MISFAIVEPEEVFDPIIHAREDLTVFSLRKSGTEGQFQRLDLAVLNERVPLPGRRLLLSEDGVLLLDGYITSSRGQIGSIVDLEVIARPLDVGARLDALCQALKTAPHYDELTIPKAQRDDISEVLAGHGKVTDWDPVTHQVTAADIFSGSRVIELEPFADTLSISHELPPSEIAVKVTASWRQLKSDQIILGSKITGMTTMTPEDLIADFVKPGDTLGTGFIVRIAELLPAVEFAGDEKRTPVTSERNLFGGFHLDPAFQDEGIVTETAFLTELYCDLQIQHTYELRRVEELTMNVPLDLQEGFVNRGPDELTIALQELTETSSANPWSEDTDYILNNRVLFGNDIYRCGADHRSGQDFDAAKWIRVSESKYIASRRYGSFYNTARGQELVAHILQRARARARHVSRCSRLTFGCAMPADRNSISTDTVVKIHSPALLCGSATGKVVEFELTWSGGRRSATVTIACAPGTGLTDILELGESTRVTPDSRGRVNVEIVNPGELQAIYFEEHGELPENLDEPIQFEGEEIDKTLATEIILKPIPAASDDLIGTVSYELIGLPSVPRGVTI